MSKHKGPWAIYGLHIDRADGWYRDYKDVAHMLEFYAEELPGTVLVVVPWGDSMTEICRKAILSGRKLVDAINRKS